MRGRRDKSVARRIATQHIGGADGKPWSRSGAAIRTYLAPYDITFALVNHHCNGATIEASNTAVTARQYKAAQYDYGDDGIKCCNMATAIDRMRM